MKISTKSWHYRLMDDVWGFRPPTNLCAYFWKTVWSILLAPLLFVVALCFLTIMTYPIWLHYVGADIGGIGVACFFLWLGAGVITRAIYLDELVYARGTDSLFSADRFYNKDIIPRVDRPESINIAAEFIRAKKDKVCPRLEFGE